MNQPMIEIHGLTKAFQGQPVLRGVDMIVPEGMVTAVIGKSGEGKSVLLKHIIGLMRQDAGEILFQGEALSAMPREAQRAFRRRCSYMFQNMALFDSMTVAENIALPLRETEHLSESQAADKVMSMAERLELVGILGKYPSQISGGMQKRVALARALVTQPGLVLFDEPTTGLDPIRKASVLQLIDSARRQFDFTAVLVSHDIPDVFGVAGHVAMLDAGRIVWQGTPEAIGQCENPVVKRFLAGEPEPDADDVGSGFS
ncbi:Methionine ABC transporter ATP-binding protein [Desulfovibrio sp. DV]|uniref:ABC transporter ATP-binding protein n=1 Tax=Desulfovibrio sp. DV TaxID=1844708 RepID=UPI00094BB288|nr:ATP-binding cassette domain-containing protein [Desulfovibrio sp. DV]OLN26643.1 Methionine ABC transporter ATP-binding protein [Desulfovibrio sp. DV]